MSELIRCNYLSGRMCWTPKQRHWPAEVEKPAARQHWSHWRASRVAGISWHSSKGAIWSSERRNATAEKSRIVSHVEYTVARSCDTFKWCKYWVFTWKQSIALNFDTWMRAATMLSGKSPSWSTVGSKLLSTSICSNYWKYHRRQWLVRQLSMATRQIAHPLHFAQFLHDDTDMQVIRGITISKCLNELAALNATHHVTQSYLQIVLGMWIMHMSDEPVRIRRARFLIMTVVLRMRAVRCQ